MIRQSAFWIMNKNIIIAMVIALIMGILSIYLFKRNIQLKQENKHLSHVIETTPQRPYDVVIDTIYETVLNQKDTIIRKYQILPKTQHLSVHESSIPVAYFDSVARALKVGEKAIKEQTRINQELKKKLSKKDLQIQEIENENSKIKSQIWTWKNKRATVIANLHDSIAQVKYNASITITDFSKKNNWFSNREYYTAVSTDDKDLTINGVQHYEQKLNVSCPKFQLGLQGGIGLVSPLFDQQNNIYPGYYFGTGVQFNF